MTSNAVVELASELIARPSVTPDDAGCQQLIGGRLAALDFTLEPMRHGDVDNLWAVRDRGGPLLVFAGHTDVVPTGPAGEWRFDPFTPTIVDGMLYGRGSADMKGSLAAMIVATERFLRDHDGSFSIGFLLTSDEEGPAVNGTRRVVETLAERGTAIDYCLIGEPSSTAVAGDMIRVGRRGSLNARLILQGVQGHVAYPDLARNPVHLGLPLLSRLVAERWDEGNHEFPPTSFQISNVAAGTGATNVIPGSLQVDFNLRFSTEQTAAGLEERIERLCRDSGVPYDIDWSLSGEPFLTRPGRLLEAVDREISRLIGAPPEHSTGGGTSDGRFIARLDCELVELGPVNATIHQVNEHVAVADLTSLCGIYQALLTALLLRDA